MSPKVLSAVLGSVVLLSRPARGDDSSCFSAAVDGQKAQHADHLLEARDDFAACSRAACDAAVVARCTRWLEEVENAVPTLTTGAHDANGHDLIEVSVFVDKKPFPEASRGAEIAVDPGPHVVRVEAPGRTPIEQTVVARAHEKGHAVLITFPPVVSVEPPRAEAPRHIPRSVYLLGGVAALSGASWAGFSIAGLSERSSRGCSAAPGCSPGNAEVVRRDLAIGDVSAGVTVAALAAATVLFLRRARAQEAPVLSVGFARGGGGAVQLKLPF